MEHIDTFLRYHSSLDLQGRYVVWSRIGMRVAITALASNPKHAFRNRFRSLGLLRKVAELNIDEDALKRSARNDVTLHSLDEDSSASFDLIYEDSASLQKTAIDRFLSSYKPTEGWLSNPSDNRLVDFLFLSAYMFPSLASLLVSALSRSVYLDLGLGDIVEWNSTQSRTALPFFGTDVALFPRNAIVAKIPPLGHGVAARGELISSARNQLAEFHDGMQRYGAPEEVLHFVQRLFDPVDSESTVSTHSSAETQHDLELKILTERIRQDPSTLEQNTRGILLEVSPQGHVEQVTQQQIPAEKRHHLSELKDLLREALTLLDESLSTNVEISALREPVRLLLEAISPDLDEISSDIEQARIWSKGAALRSLLKYHTKAEAERDPDNPWISHRILVQLDAAVTKFNLLNSYLARGSQYDFASQDPAFRSAPLPIEALSTTVEALRSMPEAVSASVAETLTQLLMQANEGGEEGQNAHAIAQISLQNMAKAISAPIIWIGSVGSGVGVLYGVSTWLVRLFSPHATLADDAVSVLSLLLKAF